MAGEITLTQSEVLVFLDALGQDHLPGVETSRLVPQDRDQRRSLLLQGLRSLTEKGLLTVEEDTHILPRRLVSLFQYLSQPEVLGISQKDTPGLGQQVFVHSFRVGHCVEMTFPDAHTYRFADLPTAEDVILRLLEIFPLQSEEEGSDGLQMPRHDFERIMNLANQVDQAALAAHLEASLNAPPAARAALLAAIYQPRFSGILTLMKLDGEDAVDARDFLCLQGPRTAWLFESRGINASEIAIQPVTPQAAGLRFAEALAALLETARP